MPMVQVYFWAGRNKEQKMKIVDGITKVFVEQNVPEKEVTVILHDIPKDNWGIGGKLSSDK